MTTIHAKTVVENKFWIVEENNVKVGVLKHTEQQKFVLSSKNTITTYDSKKKLIEKFGTDFFAAVKPTPVAPEASMDVYGFPTACTPFNPMFDVKRGLPLFTKSDKSKSKFCAGYYIFKFETGWAKRFCPKLVSLEQYPYEGPFKTKLEMKQRLKHAPK